MTDTEAAPAPKGLTRQDVFAALGALGAFITITAAIMFYFGWRRSDVQATEMNMDVGLFGFSSQDYVLRSISSLYLPLLVVFGLVIGWTWLHGEITRRLRTIDDARTRAQVARGVRWGAIAATTTAAACVLFTMATGFRSPPWPVPWLMDVLDQRRWVVPLLLIITTLLAAYLWWIYGQVVPARRDRERSLWQMVVPPVLLAGTVALGGFWLLGEYAAAVGRADARTIERTVPRRPHVVVLSPTPLGIQADGVVEERVDAGSEVRYRTTGLRLLGRSGGKVVLLHDGWTTRRGTVIVLTDNDSLAWQFYR